MKEGSYADLFSDLEMAVGDPDPECHGVVACCLPKGAALIRHRGPRYVSDQGHVWCEWDGPPCISYLVNSSMQSGAES